MAQPFATPPPASRQPPRLPALLLTVLVAVLVAMGTAGRPAPALALNDAQQLVVEAWRLVNQSFVDPSQLEAVHWRQLRQKALEKPIASSVQAYEAIESLLAPIGDPYTRLLRPAEFRTLRSSTKGTVSGVGLQLGLRASDRRIVVIAPLDDSPAAEAGILSGSEVLQVDREDAEAIGLEATASRLRGPSGTDVLVKLRPMGGTEREILLKRREVDLRPVRWRRLQGEGHTLGYLRISQFSSSVPDQVREALSDLRGEAGATPIEALILDLRNNSGGLVSAGLSVANAFLDGEPIVVTRDRGGISDRQQAGPGSLYDGAMLTLVNGGTASASEILAGALQDGGRSPLVGSRTFGKGLIQTLLSLGDGSGLAVTVARYQTPSGRDIQNRGLEPDRSLTPPEPLNPGGKGDTWLAEAEKILLQKDRPALPLLSRRGASLTQE